MVSATLCPTLALYLSRHGKSQAYCGVEPHGWGYLVFTFFVIWLGTDLWEWAYHYFGHSTKLGWEQHRHHHVFFNPSPFAVIAGMWSDALALGGCRADHLAVAAAVVLCR
jgi:lathosterol oxidase